MSKRALTCLALAAALLSGCAHMKHEPAPDPLKADTEALRQQIIAADDLTSEVLLYRAAHKGACADQFTTANNNLNYAARQFFLLTNYTHPTLTATALILGRSYASKADAAARACTAAFDKAP